MNTNDAKFELSLAQQDIYLDQLHKRNSPIYNIGGYVRCRDIAIDRLISAHLNVVNNTEAFGVQIGDLDGNMFQFVRTERDLTLPQIDFSDHINPQQSAEEWLENVFSTPIDIKGPNLCKAWLLKLSEATFWYVGLAHHIVMDGWGFANWAKKLANYYNEPLAIDAQEPTSLSWQSVVNDDSCYIRSQRYQDDTEYWRAHCVGVDRLDLHQQFNIESEDALSQTSARYTLGISREKFSKLDAFAKSLKVGTPQVFLGVLATYFSKVYDKQKLCFGIPVHNRRNYREKHFIGVLTGVSPLAIHVPKEESFKGLVRQLAKSQKANLRHQRYPLGHYISGQNLSAIENPVYEVMFNYLKLDYRNLAFSGVNAEVVFAENRFLNCPLGINVWDGAGETIELQLDYHLAYFSETDVKALANRIDKLLSDVLDQPDIQISDISVLTKEDKLALTGQNTQAKVQPLLNATVIELLEAQVQRNHAAVAVVCGDRELTYGALSERVHQLAGYLVEVHKVNSDVLVGVCMNRSLDMLIAMLAILKAGGAYVPIDPQYPASRISYMLDDAKLTTIITETSVIDQMSTDVFDLVEGREGDNKTLCICLDDKDTLQKLADYAKEDFVFDTPGSKNLAYVIYTSGSTGHPKGVMVEHHNLTNFLLSMQQAPGIQANDSLLAVTSTSFDIHGLELFLPLISGAKLVIASKQATQDPYALRILMEKHAVSVMQATPTTWKMLVDIDWQPYIPLKVLCGGEALSQSLAESLLIREKIQLWNMYGPTETTIWSSIKNIRLEDEKVLIGMPIANTRFHVVNQDLDLVPVGVPGELLIGGEGVARGYLGKDALTQERFIADPFSSDRGISSSEHLYRTGDLVRQLADGNFEYLGRLDHQIKIRGHRIELGEIESALMKHGSIKDAIVIAKETTNGEKQIVSFVVKKEETEDLELTEKFSGPGFSLFYFGADDSVAENKYELYLKSAKYADQHEFEAIWTPERHFDSVGALYPNPAVLNAALASVTDNVALRAGSVVLPLHDPIRIAEEWAMVDNLSNGRAGLAIASGWHPRDFALSPDNYIARKQVVRDGVKTLKNLWQGKTIKRSDGQGNGVDIEVFPKPVQDCLPLWTTAAGNPETFIEAGRLGTHVLTHLLGQTIEELTEKIALYRQSLSKHGHDPEAGRVTLMVHTFIGNDLEETLERARKPFLKYMRAHISLLLPMLKSLNISVEGVGERELETIADFAFERYTKTASLIGTPESCKNVVTRIVDAGVDEIACLIDWMDAESAYEGLVPLTELVANCNKFSSAKVLPDILRQHLAKFVPDYMLPSSYTVLEELPLTPNGKIDRVALQALNIRLAQTSYVPPVTKTEIMLSEIWQEVLNVERVSLTDNFFQLGGHSLQATRIVARVNQTFGVNVNLEILFNTKNLQSLAADVESLDSTRELPAITPVSREQELLASYGQQRLWLLDKIDGGSAHYNDAFALNLDGELDINAVNRAFTTIITRHESLRTCFKVSDDGQVYQQIKHVCEYHIPLEDMSELTGEALKINVAKMVAEESAKPFDLAADLMLRTRLIKLAHQEHLLLVTMHHISADGWSERLLINEFSKLYQSYVLGLDNPLSPLVIQYADYAKWQREQLRAEVLDKELAYWQQQLANLPVAHNLPLDHPRPLLQTFNGCSLRSRLEAELNNRLLNFCKAQGVTLFMGLHAAFSAFLARYSNESDIVIGSPIANRQRAETAELIGFFLNTLVLRSDLSDNPSFVQLLSQSKDVLLNAFAHQHIPFEQVVERLQPERSLSHSPLFQIVMVMQDNPVENMDMAGVKLSFIEQNQSIAKYDLTLNIMEDGLGLTFTWLYNQDLFDDNTIARMSSNFNTFLASLLEQPEQSIRSVELINSVEKNQLLTFLRSDNARKPELKCLHQQFEHQVRQNPQSVAVTFEEHALTYLELNSKANQLAHYLIDEKQVTPDTLVGICLERSTDMIVAILAILKAGGAYVPLDPGYPQARLSYMIDDAKLSTVITHSDLLVSLPLAEDLALCLDRTEIQSSLQHQSTSNIDVSTIGLQPNHLAYVIYTSGSTGQPKGVMVEHGNVHRLLTSCQQEFEFNQLDVFCLFHSYAFDFSVWEIWGALAFGGRLVVVPLWVSRSVQDFYQLVLREGVTVLNQTPTAFSQFSREDLHQNEKLELRAIVFGGEALNLSELSGWISRHGDDKPQLINMYGITETTVHVTYRRLTRNDIDANQGSLIGRPIADLQIYVLDHELRPVPIGVMGEMYVGGPGLSRGYLNNDLLTARRFIDNPYCNGQRLYRTGDLARYLLNGELEYQGRIDDQVKIRGFRIEIGEVEQQLSSLAQVDSSLVDVRESKEGVKQLVAYVKAESNQDETQLLDDVKGALQQVLPSYMIPSVFVLVKDWPLTSNGKIDRHSLPAIETGLLQTQYIAPSNEHEVVLCQTWQDVLRIEKVGIDDNFFNVGGDSILALQIVSALKSVGLAVSIRQIFEFPTIRQLSSKLVNLTVSANQAKPFSMLTEQEKVLFSDEIVDAYPMSNLQSGMIYHTQLAEFDGIYHDIMGEHIRCPWHREHFESSFEAVIAAHPLLRTGFTLGGERQLQHVFREVSLPLLVEDIRDLDPGTQEHYLASWIDMRKEHEFDWENGPLYQINIFLRSDESFQYVFSFHHSILDGWSFASLNTELFNHYAQLLLDKAPAPLKEEWIYRDFIMLEQQSLYDLQGITHFNGMLEAAPVRQVPYKADAAPERKREQVSHQVCGIAERSKALAQLATELNVPLQSVLLAVHFKVLSLLSGEAKVVSCVTHNGRPEQTDAERGLGLFLNSLPLSMHLSGGSWRELILEVAATGRESLNYRRYPLAEIQKQLGRSFAEVTFNYTHFHIYKNLTQHEDLTIETLGSFGFERTNFNFHVDVARELNSDALQLTIHYNRHLYDAEQIAEIGGYYER
ncbi:amino acid adenylation domain-containing protein, partial [Rheinheimera gaetbuli]